MSGFRYEREMAEPVRRWLEDKGLTVKAEFSTPWGICDLLGVAINEEHAQKRTDLGQRYRLGSILRTAILNDIPEDRAITKEKLSKQYETFLSIGEVEKELGVLESRKFVYSPRKNQYSKRNGWMPLQDRIVAVELKLSRIDDVIFQASSHRQITEESYIALPMKVADRVVEASAQTRVRIHGVGVLGVEAEVCVELLAPDRTSGDVDLVLQAAMVEKFW